MATDASTVVDTATDAPATPVKKRVRRVHRLGVAMVLKEFQGPDSGIDGSPEDWDFHSHKELTADDFADVLDYFRWYQQFGQTVVELATAKITELESYGDKDTRKEMSELFGGTEALAMAAASAFKKEGLSDEQKELARQRIKEILGGSLD